MKRLRPGRQDDYIKTVCPTIYKGLNEPCPKWERFLQEVFQYRQDLIDYVQRLFGYGISATTKLHILVIFYGTGRNGKGTFLETLKYILGDLCYKTEAELLLEQKNAKLSGAPNSGLLALRGKRIVFASESDDGRRFSPSKVKELTGGDTLNARGLYSRHHVEFEPSHLLILMTNHRPQAPADDYALWQRIHLVPFNEAFVAEPKLSNEHMSDSDLPEKLQSEASGILAWLIRGCLEWQRQGLNPPEVVKAATREYQADEDILGHFLNDCCIIADAVEVRSGYLYKAYQKWCEENSHRPISGTRFGKAIKSRFNSFRSGTGHIFYNGIGLLKE